MTTKRQSLIVWGLAGGLSMVACGGTTSESREPTQSSASPLTVSVMTVAESEFTDSVEVGGVVEAVVSAAIAAQVLAPVAAVRARAGDRVRAGDVLVELVGRDVEANARSAQAATTQAKDAVVALEAEQRAAGAALVLAQSTHGRISALHAQRSATTHELDEAVAALAAAEARVAAMAARAQEARTGVERAVATHEAQEAMAAFLHIRAPFDGVVTERLIEPGNMAVPGVPLLRIDDTRAFRLNVRVDESRTAHVTPGTRLDVRLEGEQGDAVAVQGTVTELGRAIDAGTRTALLKLALPAAQGMRSGAFGRVRVPTGLRKALTVPAEALVHQGQVTSVFVAADGVARLRLVRVRGTEVQAGLQPGDQVIVPPVPGLADGRTIRVGDAR